MDCDVVGWVAGRSRATAGCSWGWAPIEIPHSPTSQLLAVSSLCRDANNPNATSEQQALATNIQQHYMARSGRATRNDGGGHGYDGGG